jgi:phosphomannomutase/phosphoglucomutase
MKINRAIFREYDVRGIVGKDLTNDFAYNLAKGCASYFKKHKPDFKKVTVGYDARHSSPEFAKAMIKGFNESGIDTVFLGMVPTGILYFSMYHLKDVDGGIQITGSHNPPEYNGFKINLEGMPVYGEGIQEIGTIMENDDFIELSENGKQEEYDIIPDYKDFLKKNIHFENPEKLNVVIDAGNGVGGFVAVPVLKEMGVNVTSLYEEPDGDFPNHHPDPTVEKYIHDLIETTKNSDAQLGIGFDGDADRIGLVASDGTIIAGDEILTIFGRSILKEVPGAKIVGDVKCSKTFYDDMSERGGDVLMWKAGHSLIKIKMKEIGAELGGEMSGHIFFKHRFFGFDCAIYAAFRLLEIVSKTKDKDVKKLLLGLPKTFSTPEIRLEVPEEKKFSTVKKVVQWFKDNNYNVNDIDGMRVSFDDGWGLMRPSNTQNVIVLRFEAQTKERLEEIQNLIEGKMNEFLK